MWFPSAPPFTHDGSYELRYEDVAQDGRLILHNMPAAIGKIAWPGFLAAVNARAGTRKWDAAIPILTRFVIVGGDGPLSVFKPLQGRSTHAFAHVRDETGAVDRIYLNLWAELHGERGNTHGIPVDGEGQPVQAGKLFAEHVFTRPFAPPEQRKVRTLGVAGVAEPPGEPYIARTGAELLAPPAGFTPLDDMRDDSVAQLFGIAHTDSNQHMNSLVYPRYFEDAALRRIGKPLFGRHIEVLFRKPIFAGQTARFALQTFQRGDEYAAVGTLSIDKPHAYFRLFLR